MIRTAHDRFNVSSPEQRSSRFYCRKTLGLRGERGGHDTIVLRPAGLIRPSRTAPFGSTPGDAGGSVSKAGRQRREARGTCAINGLVSRERSLSPGTNGQIGVVRRHVVRSAAREGSEHGPYRKSRLKRL